MNYYDGTMNLQIPLYTLSEFGFHIPIQIRYKTSGIKVEDASSSVGLGWDFSAGGKITRIVQRLPDEEGFCCNRELTPEDVFRSIFLIGNWYYFSDVDSEPDLFFFEIPNYSGIFVCDRMGKVHTIPYQHIDIRWVDQKYFEITDAAGNKYTFGKAAASREISRLASKNDLRYTSAWMMERVEDQFGNSVLFSYTTKGTIATGRARKRYKFHTKISDRDEYPEILQDKEEEEESIDNNQITYIETPRYLQRIQGQNTCIEFSISEINGTLGWQKYDRITINPEGASPKSIRLCYSQFQNKALKLDAVEAQCGSQTEKIASFQYCTTPNLPDRSSMDFDHWGYYNGKNNTTLFPAFTATANGSNQKFHGADRTPNLYYTKANVLTHINYPTGGHLEYVYELNTAYDENSRVASELGGLRVKEIRRSDGQRSDVTSLYYTKAEGSPISSGVRIGEEPQYYFSVPDLRNDKYLYLQLSHCVDNVFNLQGNTVGYSRVKEVLPNGAYNIYEYQNNDNTEFRDEVGTLYMYKPNAVFPQENNGSPFRRPVKTSRFWRRGLLVKSSHFDADGRPIKSGTNHYSFGAPKAVVAGYIPEPNGEASALNGYLWKSEPVYLAETITESGPYNIASKTVFTYDTVCMVPIEIKEIKGGETILKKITYPFNYGTTVITDEATAAVHHLKERNILVPVETVTKKNDRIVQGEYTAYKLVRVGKNADATNKYAVAPASKWVLGLTKPLNNSEFTPSGITAGIFVSDAKYKAVQFFDQYDMHGNGICSHVPDGFMKSTIYGHGGTLPIAEIDNAVAGAVPDDNLYFYGQLPNKIDPLKFTFTVPCWQEVDIELYLENAVNCDDMLNINLTGQNLNQHLGVFYPGDNKTKTAKVALNPGIYSISFNSGNAEDSSSAILDWVVRATVRVKDCADQPYVFANEVFYTSFEEDPSALSIATAKTGSKVYNGAYRIDLKNFAPGSYRLNYWRSQNRGVTWSNVSELISVTSTTTSWNIAGGYYIDEVRLMPSDARMTTCTYRRDAGKTTESDINGVSVYYEYDGFGRVIRLLDNQRNPIKEYHYQIKQ